MWEFLIGVIVGAVIGVFLMALISAAPDPEEQDRNGGSGQNDED